MLFSITVWQHQHRACLVFLKAGWALISPFSKHHLPHQYWEDIGHLTPVLTWCFFLSLAKIINFHHLNEIYSLTAGSWTVDLECFIGEGNVSILARKYQELLEIFIEIRPEFTIKNLNCMILSSLTCDFYILWFHEYALNVCSVLLYFCHRSLECTYKSPVKLKWIRLSSSYVYRVERST